MSETRRKDKFRQGDDLDPSHDELFIELLRTWKDRVQELPGFPQWALISEDRIIGEAILAIRGAPLLFPDAIASGTIHIDHRREPAIFSKREEQGDPAIAHEDPGLAGIFSCGVGGCGGSSQMPFGPFPEARPRQADCGGYLEWRKADEEWGARKLAFRNHFRESLAGEKRFWQTPCEWGRFRVTFEVKTEVRSFGEVLRQLRLYKAASPSSSDLKGEWTVLFTPDPRFDAEFLSQGFPVLHPRSDSAKETTEPAVSRVDALWESLGVGKP